MGRWTDTGYSHISLIFSSKEETSYALKTKNETKPQRPSIGKEQ